jgi:hypothetical protein
MPIPPSLNNAYANATGKGRVLTTDALRWQYECNEWAMDNIPALCAVRDLAGYSRPMTLEADFHFPRSAVYTKAGEPKALDPPNFGKLLIDHIAVYAQVNDTIFFRTVFDKHVAASGASERRWVDVRVMLRDSVT